MESTFNAATSISEGGGETLVSDATLDAGQEASGSAPPAPPGVDISSNGDDPWSLTEEFNEAADIAPEMDQPVGQGEQETVRERFQEDWERWEPKNAPRMNEDFRDALSGQEPVNGTTGQGQQDALLREREMLENGRATPAPALDYTIGGTTEQEVHTEIEAAREERIREIDAILEGLEQGDGLEAEEEEGLSL